MDKVIIGIIRIIQQIFFQCTQIDSSMLWTSYSVEQQFLLILFIQSVQVHQVPQFKLNNLLISPLTGFHGPSQFFRHKPPWIFLNIKLPYINKASFAPSAGQLRILLLLLLLQMVHSLDVHTCSLLDAVFTCLLVILCWRPHFVLIPVAVIVVLLLFWWSAHRAYRALSDTLVQVVIHLIILS